MSAVIQRARPRPLNRCHPKTVPRPMAAPAERLFPRLSRSTRRWKSAQLLIQRWRYPVRRWALIGHPHLEGGIAQQPAHDGGADRARAAGDKDGAVGQR